MVSFYIRYLANITQNKTAIIKNPNTFFTECDYAEKVKRYDSFILVRLSFLKSFEINFGLQRAASSNPIVLFWIRTCIFLVLKACS